MIVFGDQLFHHYLGILRLQGIHILLQTVEQPVAVRGQHPVGKVTVFTLGGNGFRLIGLRGQRRRHAVGDRTVDGLPLAAVGGNAAGALLLDGLQRQSGLKAGAHQAEFSAVDVQFVQLTAAYQHGGIIGARFFQLLQRIAGSIFPIHHLASLTFPLRLLCILRQGRPCPPASAAFCRRCRCRSIPYHHSAYLPSAASGTPRRKWWYPGRPGPACRV